MITDLMGAARGASKSESKEMRSEPDARRRRIYDCLCSSKEVNLGRYEPPQDRAWTSEVLFSSLLIGSLAVSPRRSPALQGVFRPSHELEPLRDFPGPEWAIAVG
jgi:hypothetical protein